MAQCEYCHEDMATAASCSYGKEEGVKFSDQLRLPAVPHDGPGRCHDCNVKPKGFHHPGCDDERCPKCGGQLISCGCIK